MRAEILKLLEPWSGIDTWHTFHPTDRSRFLKVMNNLVSDLGCQIDLDEFESALREHAQKHPGVLENPEYWDKVIEKFTIKAELIIAYEAEKQF